MPAPFKTDLFDIESAVHGRGADGARHHPLLGARAIRPARRAPLPRRHVPAREGARARAARRARRDHQGLRLRRPQQRRVRAHHAGARARRLGPALVRVGAGRARHVPDLAPTARRSRRSAGCRAMAARQGDRLLRPDRARLRQQPGGMHHDAPRTRATTTCSTARRCGSRTAASPTSPSCGRSSTACIRGFLVEKGTPGFTAPPSEAQVVAARVGHERARPPGRADPEDEHAAEDRGPQGPLLVPHPGALRHRVGRARRGDGLLRRRAREYAKSRIQFGKPIAAFQLVQDKLAEMLTEITKGQLLALRGSAPQGRRASSTPQQVSMCKRNNVHWRSRSRAMARDMLGANGITDEYPVIRHMVNLEIGEDLRGHARHPHADPRRADHRHPRVPVTGAEPGRA